MDKNDQLPQDQSEQDDASEETAERQEKPKPTVVGIGASAGGLAALKTFLGAVPEDSDLAYVVVVHLSPEHESHLAGLLQPHVKMPVRQVNETVALEANQVYVIPPNANLSAIDTHLRLTELEEHRRARAPIDHFFRTLAATHDGSAIGVILTGTGSDGTLGLKEIKEKGGLTVVQLPAEAEYDGMPQSAIATGLIDLILPLAEMPEAILDFTRTEPRVTVPEDGEDLEGNQRQLLQKIFAQLRARTGRDFSRYKRSTIMRRITRRMQFNHVEELEDYLEILRTYPEEVRDLGDDLLITVTSFFRDPEVFQALEENIIPKLFEGKQAGDDLRVWSVGCATGEEAYSLAILLLEEAARREVSPRFHIFASDLHEHSLGRARDGFYPGDIEADVTAERLARFFRKENGGFRVRKEVRELVVFAPHNLLADPPFSKLDLIACRNVLIYLQRDVQRDITDLFHYALKPDGILVLGTSETVDSADLFRTEDKKHCFFRKRNVPAPEPRLPVFPLTRAHLPGDPVRVGYTGEPVAYGALHQRMVEHYAPPSLLVSPDDKVVHLSEHVGRYLVHPGGEITASVFKLVREELRIELRTGLHAAREHQKAIRTKPVPVRFNGDSGQVVLDVRPALEPAQEGFVLVIFAEREASAPPAAQTGDASAALTPGVRERELEAELSLTKQRLQAIIEEYETSQEEMKASNEEMQSANEELRSTMEELETSKEELQSMNEELQTVNQENRHKVDELAQLSGDLQNLMAATDIATLFLDRELRILRFTPKVSELFNVRMTDRGRPLLDLTHRLGYDELLDDARRVLSKLIPVEREVQDEEGRWYLTRVLPYRSAEDRIDGIVITFVDITARKEAEEELREAKTYAERIIDTLHEPLLILSPDLRVHSANPAFYMHFDVRKEETTGRLIYELGNGQWDIPALRTLLEDVLPENNVFNDYEVAHEFEQIGRRVMLLNARRLDHVQLILLGIRDITERKEAEAAVRRSEERLQKMINIEGVGVLTFDENGTLVFANDAFLSMTGYSREEVEAGTLTWRHMTPPEYVEESERQMERLAKTGRIGPYEKEYFRKDGSRSWMLFAGATMDDDTIVEYCIDISDRKQAVEALRESEERYRFLVESAQEYAIFMLDVDGRIATWNTGAERIFGYTEGEIVGQPAVVVFTEEDRAAGVPEAEIETAARRGQAGDDRWHVRKDGSRFWASGVMEALYRPDGSLRGFAKVLRDNTERKEAEAALQELNETLEDRVEERTEQVRTLASRLTMAEQEERQRISQILHDDLQQLLYGVELKMDIIRRGLRETEHPELLASLAEARGWIDEALTTMRRVTVDLSPPILRNEGLADALEWLQSQMAEIHDLKITLEAEHNWYIQDEGLRVLLFQIVRELLFNVKKHAGVGQAVVRLAEEHEHLVIHVIDEGDGFDVDEVTARNVQESGFGLFSVRERLRLLGGRLVIQSRPGKGTHIEVHTPVQPA